MRRYAAPAIYSHKPTREAERETQMTTATAVNDLIATAVSLGPTIRGFADETERGRQCPPALVEIIHEHRLFDMILPKTYGGLETDIPTMARVLEELAIADGSTAWAIGIGAGTSIIAAALPEATAREVFKPRVVTGGAQAPNGRAVPVDGGYRVSGRWGFASGCTHCSWLVGGTLVMDGDAPRLIDGFPDFRTMLMPMSDIEIIDTWYVSGLRGTGSRDMQVKDVFVPEERAVSFLGGQKRYVDGPVYRFPVLGFLALTIATIPLGIARRAIDELLELAGSKMPMGSMNKLRDRAVVQYEIAQADAKLRSARAWLYECVDAMWDQVVRGEEVSMHDRAILRGACAHAAVEAARAADTAYTLGGGTSIYDTSVLQRCMRDTHAATQHVMLAPANYETAGRLMLGLDPSSPMV
jgi:alkylation response protein AidB-like acyl-CoA dehydrogenase